MHVQGSPTVGLCHRTPSFFTGKQPEVLCVPCCILGRVTQRRAVWALACVRAGVGRYGADLAGSWNFAELSDKNRPGFLPLFVSFHQIFAECPQYPPSDLFPVSDGTRETSFLPTQSERRALTPPLLPLTQATNFPGLNQPLYYGLVAQLVKNPPTMQETWVRSLGGEDPLEKGKASHSVFWPGERHGLYSPWGRKESDTTKQLSLSLHYIMAFGNTMGLTF